MIDCNPCHKPYLPKLIRFTEHEEFDEADDFAEDEFAEDDFADESEYVAEDVPFSLGAPGFEAQTMSLRCSFCERWRCFRRDSLLEDAWELNDSPESSQEDGLLY